jgi:hypothetical protein
MPNSRGPSSGAPLGSPGVADVSGPRRFRVTDRHRGAERGERETGLEPATLSLGSGKKRERWRSLALSGREDAAESGRGRHTGRPSTTTRPDIPLAVERLPGPGIPPKAGHETKLRRRAREGGGRQSFVRRWGGHADRLRVPRARREAGMTHSSRVLQRRPSVGVVSTPTRSPRPAVGRGDLRPAIAPGTAMEATLRDRGP